MKESKQLSETAYYDIHATIVYLGLTVCVSVLSPVQCEDVHVTGSQIQWDSESRRLLLSQCDNCGAAVALCSLVQPAAKLNIYS